MIMPSGIWYLLKRETNQNCGIQLDWKWNEILSVLDINYFKWHIINSLMHALYSKNKLLNGLKINLFFKKIFYSYFNRKKAHKRRFQIVFYFINYFNNDLKYIVKCE